jgi:putative flavoprotein involved in K+ transport
MNYYDTIVIGGGQSGLACAYFLKRAGLNYIILDDQPGCGGAWRHTWNSLTLFSPAEYSSLPGWMMPKSNNAFPSREEVLNYLCSYEDRYKFSISRSIRVDEVRRNNSGFVVETKTENFYAKTIISATGTWQRPYIPDISGKEKFSGEQVHSAYYRDVDPYKGKRILVVGGGNSGAQIFAELSEVSLSKWATLYEPEFLPDDVDGRVLFNVATAKYNALKEGKPFDSSQYNLGKIVMVPSVKKSRDSGVLISSGSFMSITENGVIWNDNKTELFDTIIWCTGFGYATNHLASLTSIDEKGRLKTISTRSASVPGLWLVGYGNWTGFASATLIGVGRSARQTVDEIQQYLNSNL